MAAGTFYRPLKDFKIAQPQIASAMMQGEKHRMDRESFEFNKMQGHLKTGMQFLPQIDKGEYGEYKGWLKKIGVPEPLMKALPSVSDVSNMDDKQFGEFKTKLIQGASGLATMQRDQLNSVMRQMEATQKHERSVVEQKRREGVAAEAAKLKAERAEGRENPKTLVAQWLQKNPDASEEDIIAFNQRMKGKGVKITTNPDGTTTVEMGGAQDLGIATKNKLEKEIVDLSGQLQEVTNLENNTFTDVLTLQGKIFQKGLKLADSLKIDIGEENKQYLGEARTFIENIEKIFNSYRKEITGAQAAIKEIEMLRTSIINKKLSPTEFKHSLKSYKESILRGLRIKRMLLSQGVRGGDLGKKIDELYVSGSEVPDSEMDRRGDELAADGLSEPEVIQKLRAEGYDL